MYGTVNFNRRCIGFLYGVFGLMFIDSASASVGCSALSHGKRFSVPCPVSPVVSPSSGFTQAQLNHLSVTVARETARRKVLHDNLARAERAK